MLRFWNGAAWTAQVSDGHNVATETPVVSRSTTPWAIAMTVMALLLAAGAFMPWATIGIFSKNGIDGDGMFTFLASLPAGGLAIGAAVNRSVVIAAAIVAILAGVGACIVAWIDVLDVISKNVDPGVGLLLTGAAGAGLIATAAGALVTYKQN